MIIIPAIDLENGCVVRFVQGLEDKKVYSSEPVKTARHWARQGANLIHIVDLDGASSGTLKNLDVVKNIISSVKVPLQLGGGIRKIETIGMLFDLGLYRVILGTRAAKDRVFLEKAFKKFQDKIIVSIDSKEGKVLTSGWRGYAQGTSILGFARVLKDIGFKSFIYTDVARDGTLKGPDIKGIKSLLKETGLHIIASGGVSCLDDLSKLKALEKKGVKGVIIGKALYEGRFTLTQAINQYQN